MTGFIDELLGRLLKRWRTPAWRTTTTVSFFSDHGDYAGDYGLVEKWPSAAEDVITRVPLIVRTPGGKAGHVVTSRWNCSTSWRPRLEQAGIAAQHTHFARATPPNSRARPAIRTRAAFTEGGYARHEPHCFEGSALARPVRAQRTTTSTIPRASSSRNYPDSVGRTVAMRTATHRWSIAPRASANSTICSTTRKNCPTAMRRSCPDAPSNKRWRPKSSTGSCKPATSPPSTPTRAGIGGRRTELFQDSRYSRPIVGAALSGIQRKRLPARRFSDGEPLLAFCLLRSYSVSTPQSPPRATPLAALRCSSAWPFPRPPRPPSRWSSNRRNRPRAG